jgi:hypothetical protein
MTRDAALIDAAMTVQRWKRQFPPAMHWRMTHYIAHRLGCYPTWDAIEAEIVRQLLADGDDAARLAA